MIDVILCKLLNLYYLGFVVCANWRINQIVVNGCKLLEVYSDCWSIATIDWRSWKIVVWMEWRELH